MLRRPLVYICSPLHGDIDQNIKRAVEYSAVAYKAGCIPITPHAYFTLFLDDDIPRDRYAGVQMGLQLLGDCDELWVFGANITPGMRKEIERAREWGIPVKRFANENQSA